MLLAPDSQLKSSSSQKVSEPIFGFLLVGGALVGSQVRDIRLANELARRGYQVHVWWAFDRPRVSPLDPRITERWLFGWSRYAPWAVPAVAEKLSRSVSYLSNEKFRDWFAQAVPGFVGRQFRFVLRAVCRGVEFDRSLIERFARELVQTQVTHLLPNIEILACFARAARNLIPSRPRYLVTFQGYELYGNYAREAGIEQQLYDRLADVARDADWPGVVVSDAYAARIEREIGIDARQLVTIPPGVPVGEVVELAASQKLVASIFPQYRPDLPLVTYLGRRDSEKGLDLLMYAVRLLQHRGINSQLAICGPTAFGGTYATACRQIAENLRINVLSAGYVSNELRSALFRVSRVVVYPSIHEEPFGMVPVEAMAQGTPVVVPDVGGVAGVVAAAGAEGGLLFDCWNSGSLADRLGQLLNDDECHSRLSRGALTVAEHFSIDKLGERVLDHLELPAFPSIGSPNMFPAHSQSVESALHPQPLIS